MDKLHDVKLAQIRCQNPSCKKPITCNRSAVFLHVKKSISCNRSVMVMGGVSWGGGSWEVVKPKIIVQLKM